mmetsp:Transcript_80742/g.216480  ORF Transcript_80742/g.216480 Transcript_80742/m.216480 type:complete len:387 (+) Transcript_80742:390-1550(+)
MEIIFSVPEKTTEADTQGLRVFGLDHWKAVVATLNGSILKHNNLEHYDAYLISESSLFVYPDRVVILTCGTTTLLRALPSILESGKKIGYEMCWFQFSRKNFLYPEEQHFPHTSFDEEVKYCTDMFLDGHAHVLGPITGDHWYVYVVDRIGREMVSGQCLDRRQSFNLYMYGMDQDVAQLFIKAEPMILPSILEKDSKDEGVIMAKNTSGASFSFVTTSQEATDRSGIGSLMDEDNGSVVHDHLFDPCGYSMNGLAGKDRYWTIHITPEAHCSYVSFETNLNADSYDQLVSRVLATFQPRRATLVVQSGRLAPCRLACGPGAVVAAPEVEGYSVSGESLTDVTKGYTVQLVNFQAVESDSGTWTPGSQSSIECSQLSMECSQLSME